MESVGRVGCHKIADRSSTRPRPRTSEPHHGYYVTCPTPQFCVVPSTVNNRIKTDYTLFLPETHSYRSDRQTKSHIMSAQFKKAVEDSRKLKAKPSDDELLQVGSPLPHWLERKG